jgi:hypothetical protein
MVSSGEVTWGQSINRSLYRLNTSILLSLQVENSKVRILIILLALVLLMKSNSLPLGCIANNRNEPQSFKSRRSHSCLNTLHTSLIVTGRWVKGVAKGGREWVFDAEDPAVLGDRSCLIVWWAHLDGESHGFRHRDHTFCHNYYSSLLWWVRWWWDGRGKEVGWFTLWFVADCGFFFFSSLLVRLGYNR